MPVCRYRAMTSELRTGIPSIYCYVMKRGPNFKARGFVTTCSIQRKLHFGILLSPNFLNENDLPLILELIFFLKISKLKLM